MAADPKAVALSEALAAQVLTLVDLDPSDEEDDAAKKAKQERAKGGVDVAMVERLGHELRRFSRWLRRIVIPCWARPRKTLP